VKNTSFSPVCDACANEMDRLAIAKDYDALASYVLKQEDEYAGNNDLECAPIFFYMSDYFLYLWTRTT
jgi:hypothetical protein